MKRDDTFKDFILDQLGGLGNVAARAMFGGHGLYHGGNFFGIIFSGRLYFKTGPETRAAYRERGMQPFQPNAKQSLKNYFEVPPEIIEEPDQLVQWAQDAVRCCRAHRTP